MGHARFDVVVVGAGPAGSVAALVLARAGAHVALVDKANFPRDKACGDLVGPRGVQLLAELNVKVPGAVPVRDMVVVGPTGRRVRLPCYPGRTYPDHALAVPRRAFDLLLREAAVAAGAVAITGQAVAPLAGRDGIYGIDGLALADGRQVRAEVIIGADGATSRVAKWAGLLDHDRVMWGFAIRSYVSQPVPLPAIVLWEPTRWRALPGYGWVFPGPDGQANIGLGVGTLAHRTAASAAVRLLPAFFDHLRNLGLLERGAVPISRLGGWLKMGIVGTKPAAGRVLLVGDAAGLVNPLQGEGIAQAMRSGWAGGRAVLQAEGRPGGAAASYTQWLASEHLVYHGITATLQRALLPRPAAIAAVGRVLTLPVLGRALAPGWSVFWNELLDGASPGAGRTLAAAATRAGRMSVVPASTWRWLHGALAAPPSDRRRPG